MKIIKTAVLLFISSLLIAPSFAQESMSVITDGSDLTIYGTSSLHDWEVVAEKMAGSCTVKVEDGKVSEVSGLTFSVIVDGLKSGKSGMDDNTYKALNQEKYPKITYKLTNVEKAAPSKDGESTIFITKGVLNIAGFSKEIDLKVAGKVTADGGVQFIGKTVFNMTDYKVDPPTAVFGTIKTGDEITIVFKVVYS